MSDPAVVAAVVTGTVSFAAIVATSVTTAITLHRQRETEDKRREHERLMHLLESTLKAAVDFLAAADRTTRAKQSLDTAATSLGNAKQSADQRTYDRFREAWEKAREEVQAAVADAENAYSALRLLVPAVADQARRYLDFCLQANAHPDKMKADRQQARQTVEETLRHELGGDQISGRSPAPGVEAPPQPSRAGRSSGGLRDVSRP